MSIRLVLSTAPVSLEERYGRFSSAASTEPSFGLVCLAAAAQQAGFDVRAVEAASACLSTDQAAARILALKPAVAGISATTAGITAAGELAAKLKASRPAILTVLGGCHASAMPEQTLREFEAVDLVVVGEGERTLVDILTRFGAGGIVPCDLPGTAARTAGGIKVNPRRELIANLDELPLPAWSLLEGFPRSFRPSPARIKRMPCASVVLTRGCPNQCTFCDRSVFGNRCRAYSPAYAVKLMKDLRRNHGVREILLEDDTFIVIARWVQEFCERLIAEKLDITWSCLGRADRVTPEILAMMRKAGCWHISYGIESGDPGILNAVKKNLDVEEIEQAVRFSREAGLRTKGFFIVGFPGETRATIEATRRLALRLALDDITVMQLTPFPGSELYSRADSLGQFERDWRKMNTLETVFVPRGLTKSDLDSARATILRSFYLRPGVLWRHFVHTLLHPRLALHMLRGLTALVRAAFGPG